MAKITVSGDLVMASTLGNLGIDGNVFVDVSTKKIHLADYLLLSSDGVTLIALYSFLKTEWKDDTQTLNLIMYDFPMVGIHPEQFEFVDGWQPADALTQNYFRDGGYAIKNIDGSSAEEYFGVITLGDVLNASATAGQIYYQLVDANTGITNIVLLGTANQCVKVYGDGLGHGIDNAVALESRDYFKVFAREFKMTYDQSSKEAIGLSAGTLITYQAYRFPLSNGNDLSIPVAVVADGDELTNYPDIDITYLLGVGFTAFADATVYPIHSVFQDVGDTKGNGYDAWYYTALGGTSNSASLATDTGITDEVIYSGEREVSAGIYSPFNIIIDGDSLGTTPKYSIFEIYARIQYDLRQTSDIDIGTDFIIQGNAADSLLYFVGATLNTKPGVMVDDNLAADENSIDFYDYNGNYVFYPYVAAGNLYFNEYLKADGEIEDATDAKYALFYEYTRRFSSTALASFSGSATNTTTLTATDVDFTTTANGAEAVTTGDYVKIAGMTTDVNNGVFLVGAVTATTLGLTHVDTSVVLVDEATQTITVDTDAFGTPDAFVVVDNAAAPITGLINGVYSQAFSYNYDGNVDGHKAFGVDANVVAVALGDNKAQYVKASGTISRTKANTVRYSTKRD